MEANQVIAYVTGKVRQAARRAPLDSDAVIEKLRTLGEKAGFGLGDESSIGGQYDVAWLKFNGRTPFVVSLPLVAQQALDATERESLDALQPLLITRAAVRVLVHHAPDTDGLVDRACAHIGAYDGYLGDTYLLVGCAQDVPDFRLIVAQGVGKSPINGPA